MTDEQKDQYWENLSYEKDIKHDWLNQHIHEIIWEDEVDIQEDFLAF